MIKSSITRFLVLVFTMTGFLWASAQENDSLKILWIGNSYTYYNNLPALVTQLAGEQGLKLSPVRFLKGGQRLSGHLKNKKLTEALAKGGFDYVVIQEQSTLPAHSTRLVAAETYHYTHILDSLIKKGSPDAHVIIYMTWGHKYTNVHNKKEKDPSYPMDGNYDFFQNRMITSGVEMAYENHAWCAPVGIAWQKVRHKYPYIELYAKDGYHPSLEGSFMAAHCFLSTILQKPYVSSFTAGLPEHIASILRQEAQNAVFGNMQLLGLNP